MYIIHIYRGGVARLHSALSLQTSENEMLRAVPTQGHHRALRIVIGGRCFLWARYPCRPYIECPSPSRLLRTRCPVRSPPPSPRSHPSVIFVY